MPEASAHSPIPNKLYFKIGEVASIVGVKPYVLRYWEGEFNTIRPGKTPSRHRLYRRRDVETLLEIKRLLHVERYTIEGAKNHLRAAAAGSSASNGQMSLALGERTYRDMLVRVKRELEDLYRLLS